MCLQQIKSPDLKTLKSDFFFPEVRKAEQSANIYQSFVKKNKNTVRTGHTCFGVKGKMTVCIRAVTIYCMVSNY